MANFRRFKETIRCPRCTKTIGKLIVETAAAGQAHFQWIMAYPFCDRCQKAALNSTFNSQACYMINVGELYPRKPESAENEAKRMSAMFNSMPKTA